MIRLDEQSMERGDCFYSRDAIIKLMLHTYKNPSGTKSHSNSGEQQAEGAHRFINSLSLNREITLDLDFVLLQHVTETLVFYFTLRQMKASVPEAY